MRNMKQLVTDAIKKSLQDRGIGKNSGESLAEITNAVFGALGLTEDEQQAEGGYLMVHAAKNLELNSTRTGYIQDEVTNAMRLPPEWRAFKRALVECPYFNVDEVTRIYFVCGDTSLDAVLGACKLLNIGVPDTAIIGLRKVL